MSVFQFSSSWGWLQWCYWSIQHCQQHLSSTPQQHTQHSAMFHQQSRSCWEYPQEFPLKHSSAGRALIELLLMTLCWERREHCSGLTMWFRECEEEWSLNRAASHSHEFSVEKSLNKIVDILSLRLMNTTVLFYSKMVGVREDYVWVYISKSLFQKVTYPLYIAWQYNIETYLQDTGIIVGLDICSVWSISALLSVKWTGINQAERSHGQEKLHVHNHDPVISVCDGAAAGTGFIGSSFPVFHD